MVASRDDILLRLHVRSAVRSAVILVDSKATDLHQASIGSRAPPATSAMINLAHSTVLAPTAYSPMLTDLAPSTILTLAAS
jgi:hypothetical protein